MEAAEQIAAHDIPVYLVHSKADGGPGGVKFATSEALMDAFAELDYDNYLTAFYEGDSYTVFDDGDDFLQPNAHFSWVPFYADEDNLDWILAQTKEAVSGN